MNRHYPSFLEFFIFSFFLISPAYAQTIATPSSWNSAISTNTPVIQSTPSAVPIAAPIISDKDRVWQKSASHQTMLGDINGDRSVNNLDVLMLQDFLASSAQSTNTPLPIPLITLPCADAADINYDNKLDQRDLGLLKFIAASINQIPYPYLTSIGRNCSKKFPLAVNKTIAPGGKAAVLALQDLCSIQKPCSLKVVSGNATVSIISAREFYVMASPNNSTGSEIILMLSYYDNSANNSTPIPNGNFLGAQKDLVFVIQVVDSLPATPSITPVLTKSPTAPSVKTRVSSTPTPVPTVAVSVTPVRCQFEGLGCKALVINLLDQATETLERVEIDSDPTKELKYINVYNELVDLLRSKNCKVFSFAIGENIYARFPERAFVVTGEPGSDQYNFSKILSDAQFAVAQKAWEDWIKNQQNALDKTITDYLSELRKNSSELALQFIIGHGTEANQEKKSCGEVGDKIQVVKLDRKSLIERLYNVITHNTCHWHFYDGSCYSGLSTKLFESINNSGGATCINSTIIHAHPKHAAEESDASASAALHDRPGMMSDVVDHLTIFVKAIQSLNFSGTNIQSNLYQNFIDYVDSPETPLTFSFTPPDGDASLLKRRSELQYSDKGYNNQCKIGDEDLNQFPSSF